MIAMLDPILLSVLAAYSVVLIAAIMFGGKLPTLVVMNHTRTQLVMSFVSGLMLGIAIFHLLPHAIYTINDDQAVEIVARWTMIGLLTMFLLLRVFHFHHHDMADDAHDSQCVDHIADHHDHSSASGSDHSDGHKHDQHADTHSQAKTKSTQHISWFGIAIGLTIHTMIDGVALAASMRADWILLESYQGLSLLVGLGVFLAILLHKPLDALTISTLMTDAGASKTSRRLVLFVFALICPVSATLVLWGLDFVSTGSGIYIGAALAFSAGVFLCISLSDLLPEVHFHSHDRLKMTVVLLLGVGLALLLVSVEPEQRHSHNKHAANSTYDWKNSTDDLINGSYGLINSTNSLLNPALRLS